MIAKLSEAWRRRRASSSDESGFTLVEMVIAIPVVFLILGLVLSSAGITVGLMGQVTKGAGAARSATAVIDLLDEARNCAEVDRIVAIQKSDTDSKYMVSFDEYSCQDGLPLTVDLEVLEQGGSRVYYSKSFTLAAM